MKKTLIALAVAGLSFNAAAVDLNTGVGVAQFASEIKVDANSGTILGTHTTGVALNANSKLGFSITNGNKRYIRYDVTGGSFTGVKVADFKLLGGTPVAVADTDSSFVISQTATDGSFVIIEVVAKKDIPADADMTFITDGRVQVKNKNGVAISYRLFETALDAVANDPAKALSKANTQLLTFSPAIQAKVENKGSVDKIDVTQSSTKFITPSKANAEETILGGVSITADDKVFLVDGVTKASTAAILGASKLVLNGDFSAGKLDINNKLELGTIVMNKAAVNPVLPVTATKVEGALAELPVTAAGIATSVSKITYTVSGKAAIAPQSVTATFVPTTTANYEMSNIVIGEIGVLNKNGSTQEANLVLAPDTSYTNLVRISNTSNIAGKFFVTVIADDGKSVSFPLSAVAGQPAELAAGASTQQMKVADIYAAAEAKGLVLTGDKKLRLKVEGEVGSLSLQNYTVSKDGNALNTMNQF